jgi:histidinol-phosphate aminotransferase
MRIGYGMGSAELIEGLERIKNSFNPFPLGQLQIAAAIASFQDYDYFSQTCQRIISSREHVSEQLQKLGFEVMPSAANFVFARHSDRPAEELSLALREQGLIVRHFKKPRIDEFLRITIGTEQHNALLLDSLAVILGA